MMWSSFVFPSYFLTCLQVSYAISISNLSLIVTFWVVKHCASCQQTRVTDNRLWGIPSLLCQTGWGFFAYFRQLTQRESICVLQAEIFKGLQIWLNTKTLLNSQWGSHLIFLCVCLQTWKASAMTTKRTLFFLKTLKFLQRDKDKTQLQPEQSLRAAKRKN